MIGYSLSSFNDFPLDKFVKSLPVPVPTAIRASPLGPALTMKGTMKEILFEDLKKGDWIKHSHLGSSPLVGGYIMESPRQGRGVKSTILVDVKGSEVGMFDEIGSIYSNEIAAVLRDGEWYRVDQKRLNPMNVFPNAMLASL